MQDLKPTLPAASADDFELGMMLGSRRAFASVAGRCSAADAECLRRVREKKLYASRAATWDEFCPKFLGLSKAQANRLIRYLENSAPVSYTHLDVYKRQALTIQLGVLVTANE